MTNSAPLVGLMGKKGAGKDTVADRLVSHWGFTALAFADPLKELALDFNPIIWTPGGLTSLRTLVEWHGWDQAKRLHPEVRKTLQRLGEGVRQYAGTDVWVRALASRAAYVGGPVVVTDVRRFNEAHYVRGMRGTLVRVSRPMVDDGDTDISETELDAWIADYVIHNDGDLAQLRSEVDVLGGLFDQAGIGV